MSICDFLKGRQVGFESLLHRPASTATQFAQSLHVPGKMVAKTVLVRTGGAFVVAVLPATHRIELRRLAEVTGSPMADIASESEVEAIFRDCERGALPPFGHLYGLPTLVDVSMAEANEIVFEANTRFEGVRMRFQDYLEVESPLLRPFAAPIDHRQARSA